MSATRRMLLAVVFISSLPLVIGMLSGFSFFVTGERMTPSWVHTARILLSWLAVIAVFAWFVAGNDSRLLQRVAIVLIASWLLSECFGAGTLALIASLEPNEANLPGSIWTFRLTDMGIAVLRAVAGVIAGLTIRSVTSRPTGAGTA